MTRQSFNVGITIFKRLVRSLEKDFCHKYQLWKLFGRIRSQTAAHAQKGVKCPLTATEEHARRRESVSSRCARQIKWCDLESPFGYRGNCLLCLGIHFESIKSCTVTHSNALIQTNMGTVAKRKETYSVQVSDTKGCKTIHLNAKRIDRAGLLRVQYPNIRKIIRS